MTFYQKPAIQEIKTYTGSESPYFFSRDTMRFFGQTMKSFKVILSPDRERCFIYAPIRDRWESRFMGYTFREYKNYNLIPVRDFHGDTEKEILEYIESL